MTVINDQHQMGMHSRNGGAPSLGHGYAFRPAADQSQGRGHVFPVGQYGQSSRPSALGLIVLLTNSGGLRLPHFSQFSLRGGSSPALREGDRHSVTLPPRLLVATSSRFAGCHGRMRALPGAAPRTVLKFRQQLERQFSNAAEHHRHCLSVVGFDTHREPREANYAVLQIPTFGSRHDR
jgi:hypothetical protein